MSLKYDLPSSFYSAATLVDANHSFSLLDENVPSSKVFSELYVTNKGEYDFLKIGTRSDHHTDAYLYQETNFKDIGGGLMTFERRYARKPDHSFTVESISVPIGRIYVYGSELFRERIQSVIGAKLSSGRSFLNIEDEMREVYTYQSSNENLPVKVTTKYYVADVDGVNDGGISFGNSSMIASFLPEVDQYVLSRRYSYWGSSDSSYNFRVKGSVFQAGTIVKREPAGRYSGNIYAYKEYSLQNDLAINYGRAALSN